MSTSRHAAAPLADLKGPAAYVPQRAALRWRMFGLVQPFPMKKRSPERAIYAHLEPIRP